MKEKFDLDNYKGDYVMHCKTEKEAKTFCKFLHDNGRTWQSGDSYTDRTRWYFYEEDTVYLFNEGLVDCITANSTVDSCTILEFSDFDWSKEKVVDLPKGATMEISLDNEGFVELHGSFSGFKLEEPKFKVGDKVKWNGSEEEFTVYMGEYRKSFLNSKEEYVISYVDDDNSCLLMDCPYWFCTEWFEKVESEPRMELIKGKRYEVSNDEKFSDSKELIFYSYDEGFKFPFLMIHQDTEKDFEDKIYINPTSWEYLREIQPKYKPYEKLDVDWLGKEIVTKDGSCCPTFKTLNITHIGEKNVIINSTMCLDFNQLFKRYVWKENNLPCGEEVK